MSQSDPPEVVQTVFFAQLVVATGNEAQLIRWYAEGGEDRMQEFGVVGHSECYGLKGSFAGIEECVNLDGSELRLSQFHCTVAQTPSTHI